MKTAHDIASDIAYDVKWKIQDGIEEFLEKMNEPLKVSVVPVLIEEVSGELAKAINGLYLTLPPLNPQYIKGFEEGIALCLQTLERSVE